jgi:hypothetical protein
MAARVPTEHEEQIALVQYLTLKSIPHFRVPNETYTTSWNQKRLNKALGVQPGIPDLFVVVNNKLMAIELKRVKGGTTSEPQKMWVKILNEAGVPAKVCRGCDEAIQFIEKGTI